LLLPFWEGLPGKAAAFVQPAAFGCCLAAASSQFCSLKRVPFAAFLLGGHPSVERANLSVQ